MALWSSSSEDAMPTNSLNSHGEFIIDCTVRPSGDVWVGRFRIHHGGRTIHQDDTGGHASSEQAKAAALTAGRTYIRMVLGVRGEWTCGICEGDLHISDVEVEHDSAGICFYCPKCRARNSLRNEGALGGPLELVQVKS
jgi:hypothetical protein